MSTALAIASVTAVLKDLLINGLIDQDLTPSLGDVTVSAIPPDRIDTAEASEKSQLNLFLYQVVPNQGWGNVDLPSRDPRGERLSNPPLALNLHYLLTAYGVQEFHAEILLGYGMQLLHETPVLPRAAIRKSLAPPTAAAGGGGLPPAMQALFGSELAEQVEQIKICPQTLNTEDISKLWSAFGAKYRPTAAYQASVVLIQSRRSLTSALPVSARKIYVVPFKQPVIEQIKSREKVDGPVVADRPILAGHNLVIVGQQLRGPNTRVSVGGSEVLATDVVDVRDVQIILRIPSTLQAGVQGVQVIHRMEMGSPPTLHRGVESNVAAFVLRPTITTIGVTDVQGTGSAPRSANIALTVRPAIGVAQRVVLLLNELLPTSPPHAADTPPTAYSFLAPSRSQPSSPPLSPPAASETITIPISGVRAGSYLARVQVEGAESPLETDAEGRYDSPQVSIL